MNRRNFLKASVTGIAAVALGLKVQPIHAPNPTVSNPVATREHPVKGEMAIITKDGEPRVALYTGKSWKYVKVK